MIIIGILIILAAVILEVTETNPSSIVGAIGGAFLLGGIVCIFFNSNVPYCS